MKAVSPTVITKDDSDIVFGWCMYDWANSAYATTVLAGLLPYYFVHSIVGSGGVTIASTTYSGFTLWGVTVGVASFITFLSAPVLGAIADFSAAKKRFLLFFAYLGSLFTVLLYFSQSGDVLRTVILFFIAQVSYISANVFYDAFLPDIATDEKMDWISGKGYSYGYVGGGLQFAIALALVAGHQKIGWSQELAVRVAIGMTGLWWAGFTLITARYVPEPHSALGSPKIAGAWPGPFNYLVIGFSRIARTALHIGRFRHLLLFLLGFMLYNEGIQTVIQMATAYGTEELHLDAWQLMLTLLIIQGVAFVGALLFSKLAEWIGSKHAIMVSLVVWASIVIAAYFIRTAGQYFGLGVGIGLVLGGSQALSRSLFGSMIPEGASAEFFGFYTVFSKFSSFWGPFLMAGVRQWTNSARLSIVSILPFFIIGLILLYVVDEDKARQGRDSGAF